MTHPDPQVPIDSPPHLLLDTLRGLILQARQQVLRQVDTVQVQTYWHIGWHIVEFEQGGQARAAYGKRLLTQLERALSRGFGKCLWLHCHESAPHARFFSWLSKIRRKGGD